MHNAPAVSYPVGRSSFYGAVLACLHGIGASVLVAWGVAEDTPTSGQAVAWLLWLTSLAVAMWSWRHASTGSLTWDGQHWIWASRDRAHPVTLSVTLDLQHLMLLYLRSSDAPGLWVWLARRAAPTRWPACRRAVFARQAADQAHDADWVAP